MIYVAENSAIGRVIHEGLTNIGLQVQSAPTALAGRAGDWIIPVADNCRLDLLERWEQLARSQGMCLFPVHVQCGEVVIGPDLRPGRGGCLRCWANRCFCARPMAHQFTRLAQKNNELRPDPWLTPTAVSVVGLIATNRFVRASEPGRTSCPAMTTAWIYYFDLRTFSGQEWKFVPDSTCSRCASLQEDSPERAQVTVMPRPKPDPRSDRLRSLGELSFTKEAFVGYRSNIVPYRMTKWSVRHDAVAVVTAHVPLTHEREPQPCSGFCARYSDAETAAILEGVERYSGAEPRAFRPSVRGSFSQFSDVAVDPHTFGLHSEREYRANPGLLPYRDDLEIRFVWAYSFARQQPVLVPLQLGFYSRMRPGDNIFIAGEGSSGCSLGSCAEEAILHGIFEALERDAYMLTWYAKLHPPRIDPMECGDAEVRHSCRRLRADGFELFVFDITTDLGIPALWVLVMRDNKWPHLLSVAGAHLYPECALKKALRELWGGITLYELSSHEGHERALKLADDPSRVRTITEHSLLYTVSTLQRNFEFVTANPVRSSLREMECRVRDLWSADLADELKATIGRIISGGCDVLAVDQTAPEQTPYGLRTFKVLIPGAVPGTWGDHRRRFECLPRLDAALSRGKPTSSGGSSRPNPMPHPFP
jgi:ribosomal protein S12 methylthiotransferase accessory factor